VAHRVVAVAGLLYLPEVVVAVRVGVAAVEAQAVVAVAVGEAAGVAEEVDT